LDQGPTYASSKPFVVRNKEKTEIDPFRADIENIHRLELVCT
jgi:hypothetical protein